MRRTPPGAPACRARHMKRNAAPGRGAAPSRTDSRYLSFFSPFLGSSAEAPEPPRFAWSLLSA